VTCQQLSIALDVLGLLLTTFIGVVAGYFGVRTAWKREKPHFYRIGPFRVEPGWHHHEAIESKEGAGTTRTYEDLNLLVQGTDAGEVIVTVLRKVRLNGVIINSLQDWQKALLKATPQETVEGWAIVGRRSITDLEEMQGESLQVSNRGTAVREYRVTMTLGYTDNTLLFVSVENPTASAVDITISGKLTQHGFWL